MGLGPITVRAVRDIRLKRGDATADGWRVETLFDGRVGVAFSQAYITSRDDWVSDLHASFAGQVNGLCGAAQEGFLWLTTGSQNGEVAIRVERHESEPAIEGAWEEIVEVSFSPITDRVNLSEWAGEVLHAIDLPRTIYRVRYHATGMDEGKDRDRYKLIFWPSAPRGDQIIKRTSQAAAHWHAATAE